MKSNLALTAMLCAATFAPATVAQNPRYYPGQDPRDASVRQGSDYAEIVRCESVKKRIAYCEVSTSTRDGVHLIAQFSDAACVEGRSWGYERGRIWVDQGCAAEFGVGGAARLSDRGGSNRDRDRYDDGRTKNPDRNAQSQRYDDSRRYADDRPYQGAGREYVTCESKDNRRRHCAADLRGRQVSVYQNISRIPCEEGRSWGWDETGVWVDQGCRAEFGITSAGLLQPR